MSTDTVRILAEFMGWQVCGPHDPLNEHRDRGGMIIDDAGNVRKCVLTADENLYRASVRLVVQEQRCSVSFLQRRFALGYTQASRYDEKMVVDGVASGLKPGTHLRDVLVTIVPDGLHLPVDFGADEMIEAAEAARREGGGA